MGCVDVCCRDTCCSRCDLLLGLDGLHVIGVDRASPTLVVGPSHRPARLAAPRVASSRRRAGVVTCGWSIRKFVRTVRRYRTITFAVGDHTVTAEDPIPDDLADALAAIC